MLGEPACGKSPLGRSVLMAQCRFNKNQYQVDGEPCIRCSPEIDFLRGETGTVIMGDFLDDPCAQSLGLKALKSLLDVGLYESMSWARWGAVKWVQNQPRALAANAYDASVIEGESFIPMLKFETFWEMVRPCTKQFVYYRKNGVNDDQVPRKCIPDAGYLTDEGKKWYGKVKNNHKGLPPNFEVEVQKEQAWLSLIFKKLQEQRQPDWGVRQHVRGLFHADRPESSCLERAASMEGERVAIKREREKSLERKTMKAARAWSVQLKAGRTVIDP
jgi:hypothetical protein